MPCRGRSYRLFALVAVELGAAAWLHAVAGRRWPPPSPMDLFQAPPGVTTEAVVAGVIWPVAELVLAWLALGTMLQGVATVAGSGALARMARRVTVRFVRRLVDGALTATLVASPGTARALPAMVVTAPRDEVLAAVDREAVLPPALAFVVAPAGPEAGIHVVRPGEDLWSIAAAHVGPSTSVPMIVDYWRRLVAANLPRLRSGDPDLIHPGETLFLPGR